MRKVDTTVFPLKNKPNRAERGSPLVHTVAFPGTVKEDSTRDEREMSTR